MGGGMRWLLSVILAIATTRNGVVLIDEVENGIHYSAMTKVWEGISKAAKEFNRQIVATTHSFECLQAAYEGVSNTGISDEFRYVRLDLVGEDIVAQTYSDDVFEAALNRGWEVR